MTPWVAGALDWLLVRRAFRVGMIQKRGEILDLLREVRRLRPRRVLEIGSAAGGTLFLWTRAATADATVVSVSLPDGADGSPAEARAVRRLAALGRRRQRVHLLRDSSHSSGARRKLVELLDGRPLDFLFMDGDHSYDGVARDFSEYVPLVRPGGLVALHDIHPHSRGWGGEVPRFWGEIRERHVTREFLASPAEDGFGIGLIRVPE